MKKSPRKTDKTIPSMKDCVCSYQKKKNPAAMFGCSKYWYHFVQKFS